MKNVKEESALEEISGTIERITFRNAENGFTVLRLKLPKQTELTSAVGHMPPVQPGERILCRGQWRIAPLHGRQFNVSTCVIQAPADLLGLQKYLGSGLIAGIGPKYAELIIERFAEKTLEVIDQHPEELATIPGIGKKRLEKIRSSWQEQKSIRELLLFLQRHAIFPSFAPKIFKIYGKDSIARIEENPYLLAQDITGIGFKTADKMGLSLGIAKEDPLRIDSGLEFLLLEESGNGHVCLPYTTLTTLAEQTLEIPKNLIQESLDRLKKAERIVIEPIDSEELYVWLKGLHLTEIGIAREFARLMHSPALLRAIDIDKAVQWVEKTLSITLAEKQKEAVALAATQKILLITGGPGTGKSTITKAILAITSKLTNRICLAAPTGKAAKRLSEITRKQAFTLHSLLQYDHAGGGFRRNRENPIACDLIIIDEASMIDTSLMYHLLKAIPSDARLILVGDIDQLPSIGPGTVLKDLISSETLPTVRLNQIFRQAAHSKIITNAHRINEGQFPDLRSHSDDFLFFQADDPQDALERIVELVTRVLPKSYHFDPFYDIQVLTPMKRGILGTETLNIRLQQALNPQTPIAIGSTHYAEGDKVIQIRNNYEKEVFNGDIGRIETIDKEEGCLSIDFEGRSIDYSFSEMDEIALAYAISIHKFQGSESPCILCPIHTTHFIMLHRNLLYTAITRGKKQVTLVGTPKAVGIAVKNDQAKKRYSGLKKFLTNFLL